MLLFVQRTFSRQLWYDSIHHADSGAHIFCHFIISLARLFRSHLKFVTNVALFFKFLPILIFIIVENEW